MSAFGPALFVSRVDGNPIDEPEQAVLLGLIRAIEPRARIYDYDDYEPNALGVLLHSAYGHHQLPDEVRADQDAAWSREAGDLAARIESRTPGVYAYQNHPVEG